MAPRVATASGPTSFFPSPQEKWVKVTWMPHTTLSQTSHVCLGIRSAHANLSEVVQYQHWKTQGTSSGSRGNDDIDKNPDPASLQLLSQLANEEEDQGYSLQQQQWSVRVSVYAVGGLPLVPVPALTPSATVLPRQSVTSLATVPIRPVVGGASYECCWDAFIQIPIRWRDLPRDSYLKFEIIRLQDIVLYEATMPFFSLYGRLATGLQKIELKKPPLEGDRNFGVHDLQPRSERISNNQWDASGNGGEDMMWKASCILDHLERLEEGSRAPAKTERTNHFGQIRSVPWLDRMTKDRCKDILANGSSPENELPAVGEEEKAFLVIELPTFDIPIMHEETFYPTPQTGASGAVTPLDLAVHHRQKKKSQGDPSKTMSTDPLELVQFLDYENENDNPVEDKYRTLAHDLLRGLVDPALKPDREQQNRLAAIIDSTSFHPTREEKDLLWRFRFSLVNNRRALTKFLLAVDWTVDSEVVQAAELLEQWRKRSPIEVTDALKLLGKHVAFQTNLVRSYAIDTLAAAPDSELRLYLLQLVQALKYETNEATEGGEKVQSPTSSSPRISSLGAFLIDRASANIELANFLYWYLKVELDHPTHGARYREVFDALKAKLSSAPFHMSGHHHTEKSGKAKAFKSIVDKIGTSFLGAEAPKDKDRSSRKIEKRTMWDVLISQDEFISGILRIQQQCRDGRGKKDAKELELQVTLAKGGFDQKPNRFPIPLPSAPDIFVDGVNPGASKVFKSALYPALIEFHVAATLKDPQTGKNEIHPSVSKQDGTVSSFKVIVKTGDDLRQDQLIMMMIQLMDGLLKRAALDLCLTPYSILATSPTSGLVEFVGGSIPISQILSQNNGSILQFFQSTAPQPGAKYNIQPSVMSTYIRSVAGYCVITYILGVGDRHLDNILLRASGHFFHIDFGFIFGRDPKPLPPAFRLTREMAEGMGGTDSNEYRQFCSLACQAFNALRKSAGLVLNLLHLMSDAGIEDLSNNPAADAEGVIAKVEERFRLDLTDEQAERYFVGLINDCLSALAPRVMDVFHSFAVARR